MSKLIELTDVQCSPCSRQDGGNPDVGTELPGAAAVQVQNDVPANAPQVDDADMILRKPVANISSVKMALSASTARIEFLQKSSPRQSILTYPYLKHPELVSIILT